MKDALAFWCAGEEEASRDERVDGTSKRRKDQIVRRRRAERMIAGVGRRWVAIAVVSSIELIIDGMRAKRNEPRKKKSQEKRAKR
jgi:hypothetical protein